MPEVVNEYGMRLCSCGKEHLGLLAAEISLCFTCAQVNNPYAAKTINLSVDSAGDDSTNPSRIRDGSSIYNLALPPVSTPTGERNAYGQQVVSNRPVTNNEVGTGRRLKEYAKRAGLTVISAPKRAR